MTEPRWQVLQESELTLPDHEAIAAMLAQAFPTWSHWYVGGRSWSGMEPERRIVATEDDVVVAHAGIRRQFVTAAGGELLVGVVGLVAVTPRMQGQGLGRELLARTNAELERLRVPFGLLGTGERRRPYYTAGGWHLVEDTIATFTDFTAEGAGLTVTDDEGWLVLPVQSPMEAWPSGPLWLNGQLV